MIKMMMMIIQKFKRFHCYEKGIITVKLNADCEG